MEQVSLIDDKAVEAAIGVLDRHFAALNAGDTVALAQTLHFPHYRLAGSSMQVWEHPGNYYRDFRLRVGNDWHHSAWDFRNPICSSQEKVHLDTQFSRYRIGGSLLGRYRSIWVVTCIDGRWAAQLRSSFAT
jgi:hypothetical protein